MNYEPIQFLPVTPFWKQAQPAPTIWNFARGVVLGCALASAGFVLFARFCL